MSLLPYATPDGIVYYVSAKRFNALVSLFLQHNKITMSLFKRIATPHPESGYVVSIDGFQTQSMHLPNLREADLPFINRQNDSMLIQDRFPHLTPDEREFLISGLTPADWEVLRL